MSTLLSQSFHTLERLHAHSSTGLASHGTPCQDLLHSSRALAADPRFSQSQHVHPPHEPNRSTLVPIGLRNTTAGLADLITYPTYQTIPLPAAAPDSHVPSSAASDPIALVTPPNCQASPLPAAAPISPVQSSAATDPVDLVAPPSCQVVSLPAAAPDVHVPLTPHSSQLAETTPISAASSDSQPPHVTSTIGHVGLSKDEGVETVGYKAMTSFWHSGILSLQDAKELSDSPYDHRYLFHSLLEEKEE
ncbi:hypothetical protein LWI28_015429 [Acer negundo]|uniref:Uncharacterized protein n=1 Tax=Acer negundo TaxID=4023 RepID=A0AAD5IVI0_ACENE|nr:hypothetical protein LWI28_015429 [Acer negundo]